MDERIIATVEAVQGGIGAVPTVTQDKMTVTITNSHDSRVITKEVPYIPIPPIADLEQWLFDAAFGNAIDKSKIAIDRMGAETRPIQRGRCYDFDGTDDYITIPDNDDFSFGNGTTDSPFSISAWIYIPDATATEYVITKWDFNTDREWSVEIDADEKLTLSVYDESAEQGAHITTSAGLSQGWHHICITYDGTGGATAMNGVNIYVDSVAVSTVKTNNASYVSMENLTAPLLFGGVLVFGSPTGYFSGSLFGVKIWNGVELTSAEVLNEYQHTAVQASSLVAMYKCDEQAGSTAYDSSGNGYHGTITNATLSTFHATQNEYSFQNEVGYSEGASDVMVPRNESDMTKDVLGNALDYSGRCKYNANLIESNCGTFDGTNDYINTGQTFQDTFRDSFSISLWIKPEDGQPAAYQVLLGSSDYAIPNRENAFLLYVDSTGKLYAIYESNNKMSIAQSESAVFTDGLQDWHHITVVASSTVGGGGSIKLYFDAEEVGSTTSSSIDFSVWTNSRNLYIGCLDNAGTAGAFFDGSICDVRIFDTALSAEEVEAVYKDTSTLSPVAHYPIAEGSGATAYDVSGNGYHGTITNATLSSFWGSTQDEYHHNLLKGFDLWSLDGSSPTEYLRVPFDVDGNRIKTTGDTITGYTWVSSNYAKNWHNDAETKLEQFQAPALIQADIASGNDFWFDSASSYAAQKIGYSDIDDNDGDDDVIFADISVDRIRKNILTYSEALTGDPLLSAEAFVNIT